MRSSRTECQCGSRESNGILLFVLGAIATIAPLFSSVWGVPIVGVAIFLSGIVELADAWYLRQHAARITAAACFRCSPAR